MPEMQLVDAARLSCLPLQGRCILGVAAASARSPQLTAQWPHMCVGMWVEFVLCQFTVGSIHNYQPGPCLSPISIPWGGRHCCAFSRFGGSLKERQLTLPFVPKLADTPLFWQRRYSYESGRYFGAWEGASYAEEVCVEEMHLPGPPWL